MDSGTTGCRAPCESGTVYKHLERQLNVGVGQPSAGIRDKNGWSTCRRTWAVAIAEVVTLRLDSAPMNWQFARFAEFRKTNGQHTLCNVDIPTVEC